MREVREASDDLRTTENVDADTDADTSTESGSHTD